MNPPRLRNLIALSIAAALVTLGLKSASYLLTGSVSLLSDALESLINLVAALAAYFSFWYSSRPIDANHTYGHEKIEYFSSGLEGALIVVAGIGIIFAAVHRFIVPVPLEEIGLGAGLSLAASLVNLFVARLLIQAGRKHESIILEADGQHLMSDVWTSAGVIVGLFVVKITDWEILDPVIACLVAVSIAWTGYTLVRRSFNGLMDHALPEEEQAKFRAAVQSQLPEGMQFHALRTRQAGPRRFADFHLLVPGSMRVRVAHDLAEKIEAALRQLFPALIATIHIEPIEAEESWNDNMLEGIEPPSTAPGKPAANA